MKYTSSLSFQNIVRFSLIPLFLYFFIQTLKGSYYGYLINDSWNMGDWLTNYQGGFIRRGLTGEIAFQLHAFTQTPPGLWVFIMQIFFYSLYFACSLRLLWHEKNILPYMLLIISPILFTFQIHGVAGGYRKEVIGIAFIAYAALLSVRSTPEAFKKAFVITLLMFSIAILTHELLLVFLPYLFAIYFITQKKMGRDFSIKTMPYLILVGTPALVSFVLSCAYMGTEKQIAIVLNSLGEYSPGKGAITSLLASTEDSFNRTWHKIMTRNQKNHYFISLLFISLAFIPIRNRIKYIFTQPASCLMICASYGMTLPLFLVGTDWGRFIYLHVCSLFLLSLTCNHISTNSLPHFIKIKMHNKKWRYGVIAFFLIALSLYSTQWKMHHCCL